METIFTTHCMTCRTTGKPLLKESFYKLKDGTKIIQHRCRACNTRKLKAYRATVNGRLRTKLALEKSINKHYYKQVARYAVATAVRKGQLMRSTICKECNKTIKVEAHHQDYSKPLDVLWLCRACHANLHRNISKV